MEFHNIKRAGGVGMEKDVLIRTDDFMRCSALIWGIMPNAM